MFVRVLGDTDARKVKTNHCLEVWARRGLPGRAESKSQAPAEVILGF